MCDQNLSTPNNVLYGERKQMYGWKIDSMAIRSEAEDGEDLHTTGY